MPTTSLADVLERNARHAESLSPTFFEAVKETQEPAAVSVCCADSRVSQEAMWDVQEPGWLFTPSTIGNQVWDSHDGERVVDGSVLYPIEYTGTEVMLIVGHTGCGAIAAALEAIREDEADKSAGVGKWVDLLAPVIKNSLAGDRIDSEREASLINQLVEYNVDRQIEFLQTQAGIPAETSLFGFVYDFQGVYGDMPGRAYLVNIDGETDTSTLEAAVPSGSLDYIHRPL